MYKTKILLIAAAMATLGGAASAVTVSQTGTLTQVGEDFTFNFSGITNFVGGASVTIATAGSGITPGLDLSGAFTEEDEYFEVQFDTASQGFFSCAGPSSVGATPISGAVDNSFNFNDCAFSLPLSIDGASFAAYLADATLSVSVLFGGSVSFADHADQFTVALTYDQGDMSPVPLPASALMLGAGLLGLGAVSRRRKTRA